MKIILSAINTKHTHSALALACLKSYWEKFYKEPIYIKEFNLNILNETIINDLILLAPEVLAFSCYIWSLPRILAVSSAIKTCFPDCKIILGGPEVSYNSEEVLEKHPYIDVIIRGEGEVTFSELLHNILNNLPLESVRGITYRKNNDIVRNKERQFVKDLDELPSPFITGNYKGTASFTYYEASRGCPSKCGYCLSSIQGNVRNHSLERIKADLDWFFESDFNQIRFADRTFNHDIPRAKEIINYIKKNNHRNKNFHFEIQADFLSEELIELLSDVPKGVFHLEIGVQSTNPKALETTHRKFNLDCLKENVKKLKEKTNCYLHLDVLGGLPHDTYQDFCRSLDDVSNLEPEDIQISLVKILHGTPFEYMAKKWQLFYMPQAPYTILRTAWITPEDASMISQIGKLVEGISNTNRFQLSLNFLKNNIFNHSFSKLYERMVRFWRSRDLLFYNFSPENTVKHLKEFARDLSLSQDYLDLIDSILEHELRLTLKCSNADDWHGPDVPEALKKSDYKLCLGYRAYWYRKNPISNSPETAISNYPIVYCFRKDSAGVPSASFVELKLEESFAMISIQKKIPIYSLDDLWKRLYPNRLIPKFNLIIDNLRGKGYIEFTAHRKE